MHIIVQKFGGTSVATSESRKEVVKKIKQALQDGFTPVVVVSAMGRVGAPYATDTLINFVSEQSGALAPHSYDLLVSCGEIISAVTLTTLLNTSGVKAKAFTGGQAGIITNEAHKKADLLYTRPEHLLKAIHEGIVPVITGFQGMTQDGEFTTIGRGGSDTSASMIGMSLSAEKIEIYTDVDGIMTADPNICQEAKIIPELSYSEVFQMADSGAKVIHPRAVEYAMKANIPLVIKNTFSEAPGTCISSKTVETKGKQSVITSIAHKTGRIQFKIYDTANATHSILSDIAENGISIDLINILTDSKLFTIDTQDESLLCKLLEDKNYKYSKQKGCAKVTVIGERMTGVPGIMARIITALNKENIEIYQTADSLTTIACLVKEEHVIKTIKVLHHEFNL